jgi:shikimate dehydrogenase
VSDLYAVVGNPISHSKSPLIHGLFAKATEQDMVYEAIEAPIGGFHEIAEAFRASGGRGLNVTAPFKLDAFAMARKVSQSAQLAGAANALRFDGEVVEGENFDGVGLVRDIVHNLGVPLAGKRILLLGAGGAARGALLPMLAQKPALLHIVNRTVSKAHDLARMGTGQGPIRASGYDAVDRGGYHAVINATSASLSGELPPVTKEAFVEAQLAYELAYAKGLTPFLALAGNGNGDIAIADGVGMLVEQAAEAFAWWRGVRPRTEDVIRRITVPLS